MMTEDLRTIFQKQLSTLNKARKATEEGPKSEDIPGFVLSNFWLHYTLGVSSLIHNVTKLDLLRTDPTFADVPSVKTCIMEIEAAYMSMVNAYISLPKSEGTQLCKALGSATQSILTPLHTYFTKIHEEPSGPALTEVGAICRSCEIVSNLPKDNKTAVIKLLETENEFIKDALDELQEEVRSQRGLAKSGVATVEGLDGWSRSEVEVVEGGVSLVSTIHSALSRINSHLGQLPSSASTRVLDLLASATVLLSPALDNLISSLYPPIELESLNSQVEDIVNTMQTLLDLVTELVQSKKSDERWKEEIRGKLTQVQGDIRSLVASSNLINISSLSID